MFVKTSQVLTGLTLALTLSAVAVPPAEAEPKNEEVLISQLAGHEFYVPFEIYQDDWVQFMFEENLVLGRVRGKAGNQLSIELLSPESVMIGDKEVTSVNVGRAPYNIRSGDDVLLKYDDVEETWVLIDDAMTAYEAKYSHALPYWVSRLELRQVDDVERTAIDFGDTAPVGLPPAQQSTVYQEPAPAPVRGLW